MGGRLIPEAAPSSRRAIIAHERARQIAPFSCRLLSHVIRTDIINGALIWPATSPLP